MGMAYYHKNDENYHGSNEITTSGHTTELYNIWRKHAPPSLKQKTWRRFAKLVPDWFPATGSHHCPKMRCCTSDKVLRPPGLAQNIVYE